MRVINQSKDIRSKYKWIEKYGKYGWVFAKINPWENKGEISIDVSELEGTYKNHLFTAQYLTSTDHLSHHLQRTEALLLWKIVKNCPRLDRGSVVNMYWMNEWAYRFYFLIDLLAGLYLASFCL